MKKKLTDKASEKIIFITLNESLKKTIHDNMATVYNINFDNKKKRKIKIQINVGVWKVLFMINNNVPAGEFLRYLVDINEADENDVFDSILKCINDTFFKSKDINYE